MEGHPLPDTHHLNDVDAASWLTGLVDAIVEGQAQSGVAGLLAWDGARPV